MCILCKKLFFVLPRLPESPETLVLQTVGLDWGSGENHNPQPASCETATRSSDPACVYNYPDCGSTQQQHEQNQQLRRQHGVSTFSQFFFVFEFLHQYIYIQDKCFEKTKLKGFGFIL